MKNPPIFYDYPSKPRLQSRARKCNSRVLFALALCAGLLFFVMQVALLSQGPLFVPVEEWGVQVLRSVNADSDRLWFDVLKFANITYMASFDVGKTAISEKYLVILDNRFKAVAKPVETQVGHHYPIIDSRRPYQSILRRADRRQQGAPELVATHVDRVLGRYRKPAMAGRVVSSKVMYQGFPSVNLWKMTSLRRAFRFFVNKLSPTHFVYVVLQPWVQGMRDMSFSVDEYMLLTKRTNDSHLLSYLAGEDQSSVLSRSEMDALGQRRRDRLKDISDTLIFDYLIDDHDRMFAKNWVTAADGSVLAWDSGLALAHGPFGFKKTRSCLDVLCGLEEYRKEDVMEKKRAHIMEYLQHINDNFHSLNLPSSISFPLSPSDVREMSVVSMNILLKSMYGTKLASRFVFSCTRVCLFSLDTVRTLQELAETKSFGNRIRDSLASDLLFPAVHTLKYEHHVGDEDYVQFKPSEFFAGFDMRLGILLHHIEQKCEKKFGESVYL